MSKDKLQLLAKIKSNPEIAVFNAIQEMKKEVEQVKKETKEKVEEMAQERFEKMQLELENKLNKDVGNKVSEIKDKVDGSINSIDQKIEASLGNSVKELKKNNPILEAFKAIPKLKGEDGKDYVLTEEDKEEIASNIEVPVVKKVIERTEIKPMVSLKTITEVKEVAMHEEPQEIANKLNTLDDEIEIKTVKGLKKALFVLRERIASVSRKKGGSGGGMGNVIHQQFDGDGGTTDFTLSDSVAGNGTAVIGCRYQGQMQYLGDQFTISGRTLTMTFTPANGTKIEITYIRG